MWPELIPFLVVMAGGVVLPSVLNLAFNKGLKNGYAQGRNEIRNIRDYYGFQRDEYLMGSKYKAAGLEVVPDKV